MSCGCCRTRIRLGQQTESGGGRGASLRGVSTVCSSTTEGMLLRSRTSQQVHKSVSCVGSSETTPLRILSAMEYGSRWSLAYIAYVLWIGGTVGTKAAFDWVGVYVLHCHSSARDLNSGV
jgi:hypothetical protein